MRAVLPYILTFLAGILAGWHLNAAFQDGPTVDVTRPDLPDTTHVGRPPAPADTSGGRTPDAVILYRDRWLPPPDSPDCPQIRPVPRADSLGGVSALPSAPARLWRRTWVPVDFGSFYLVRPNPLAYRRNFLTGREAWVLTKTNPATGQTVQDVFTPPAVWYWRARVDLGIEPPTPVQPFGLYAGARGELGRGRMGVFIQGELSTTLPHPIVRLGITRTAGHQ